MADVNKLTVDILCEDIETVLAWQYTDQSGFFWTLTSFSDESFEERCLDSQ